MINQKILCKRLKSVSLNSIAEQTNFTKRSDGKITPLNFVLSFFISIQNHKHTLGSWATHLGILIRKTFSYNGMKNAQNSSRVDFAKLLLQSVIHQQLNKNSKRQVATRLLEKFNRVFLEDSTCINLPKCLSPFFPGSFSRYGTTATAKIQLRQELKSGTYTNLEVQSFRNNDQKYSPNILDNILPNDLIIRDLGYWVLSVFEKINAAKAFFISRLKFGVNLYELETGNQIDLPKLLRKATRNKQTVVEISALVGSKAKVKGRIVAIKCPPRVTRKRRKAAKKNRHSKANHSKDYFELLGWTIFFTNVESTTLSSQEILEVYGYRWRIEIIFKCWKSHFRIDHLFNTQTKWNKQQVEIAFYLFLVWLTLFFVKMYNFFLVEVYSKKQKILSLMKFAKFVKEHLSDFLSDPDLDFWIDHLAYYCTYKKRNDRLNFCEQLFLFK